jgi:hypothetical protein
MSPKYKVFNDKITNSNQFIIEQSDENTNIFTKTVLFAMYLFLTGMFFIFYFFFKLKLLF